MDVSTLKAAYEAVFDENGQIRNCGRQACINLIQEMEKHSLIAVGDENTGIINVEILKAEYKKIINP